MKKLKLKKETIASLSSTEMNQIVGGLNSALEKCVPGEEDPGQTKECGTGGGYTMFCENTKPIETTYQCTGTNATMNCPPNTGNTCVGCLASNPAANCGGQLPSALFICNG